MMSSHRVLAELTSMVLLVLRNPLCALYRSILLDCLGLLVMNCLLIMTILIVWSMLMRIFIYLQRSLVCI